MSKKIVFLLEEESVKAMLEEIVPKINPNLELYYINFKGKQKFKKRFVNKIKYFYNDPNKNTTFIVLLDKDSSDCKQLKNKLQEKLNSGIGQRQNQYFYDNKKVYIRIVCSELESFFLGDLQAVGKAYSKGKLSNFQQKEKFRNPDNLTNAKEELKKLVNYSSYIDGSRKISSYMDINNNQSTSFNLLIKTIQEI